jgi:hypothetical protein
MSNAVQKVEQAQQVAVVPISDSAALMAAVARAAADPAVDVEKMERLFAMHERMADRQAEQAYADAMTAAQRQMPTIGKDRQNTQTNSWYSTLDKINQQIAPIYTAHGFSLSFDTQDSTLQDHVRVVCRVLHSEGHSKTYHYDTPMDSTGIAGKINKTPTHARGSAVTYGRRYLTLMIFNLATGEDDDGNTASGGVDAAADWYSAIDAATSMDELQKLAGELKSAHLTGHALRNVRAAWAKRSKEVAA